MRQSLMQILLDNLSDSKLACSKRKLKFWTLDGEHTKMGGKTFPVTDNSFQDDVLGSDVPVLVDFWAEWCGPCKMIAPIVEELSLEYDGQLKVAKLDADENMATMQQYGIMGIPTLILFKGGQPVERVQGFKSKEVIVDKVVPHLS